MKHLYNKFPRFEKQFSICDTQIDAIICEENIVRFVFTKGFFVIEDNSILSTSAGYIEFNDCNSDEFICHIIQRESTQSGAKLYGQPLSLNELANILAKDNRKIELYLELYDFNYLHWRGTLLPYKTQGLSDNIIIESSGCFSVTCYWE